MIVLKFGAFDVQDGAVWMRQIVRAIGRCWVWGLEKGGQNNFSDGFPLRPMPPPPMYLGSIFPHFDVNVSMPKGTKNPRVNS